ncbi:hypothetical protein PMI08_02119 [Brevibacillus sp. CF112]|uniref:hypothetical protein n=1 Tax=Brevibacillus TaxID=55080 RepID=UPI000271B30D|nr:hypothetical protein [Brevibacillus sp. CF112]EJL44001.1 hypothetical protein PMI08_02119 [Brevibacillus sp. CF112]
MSVQISINGDNAAEAVKELASLAAHFTLVPVAIAAAPAEAQQEERPKRQRSARQSEPAADKPTAAPAQEPEVGEVGGDPADDASEGTGDDSGGDPIPTIVELRARAQEIGKTAEGKKAIKALLDKFGSKSLSDLPEEKRAEFMDELAMV